MPTIQRASQLALASDQRRFHGVASSQMDVKGVYAMLYDEIFKRAQINARSEKILQEKEQEIGNQIETINELKILVDSEFQRLQTTDIATMHAV